MSRLIYKYELPPPVIMGPPVTIPIHFGAEVLSAAAVGDGIFVWAALDARYAESKSGVATYESRSFLVVPTGHPFEEDAPSRFIGTVTMRGGALVFHVFEVE